MNMQKHAWIAGAALLGMGALHAAAFTASVVVDGDGSGGAGADDSASSAQGQDQAAVDRSARAL